MPASESGNEENPHWRAIVKIPMSLRRAYLSMHRRTNQFLRNQDLTADQYVCMVILNLHGDLKQTELVKHANSDPNTMKAMLLLLEKKGFILRKPHPSDRRARLVSLTQAGEGVVKSAAEQLEFVHLKAVELFSESDADQLNRLLELYTEMLDSVGSHAE